jgi:hypothetical protein
MSSFSHPHLPLIFLRPNPEIWRTQRVSIKQLLERRLPCVILAVVCRYSMPCDR